MKESSGLDPLNSKDRSSTAEMARARQRQLLSLPDGSLVEGKLLSLEHVSVHPSTLSRP